MRAVLAILLGACLVHAEPLGLNCASCQLPIKGKYLLFSAPGSPDKAPVCEACAQLETSCFLCGIPVKADGLKLEDGRFVCPRDSQTAVFSQPEAVRIFEEVKRNLLRMFSGLGVQPDQTIEVSLVNKPQLERRLDPKRRSQEKCLLMGVTQTRRAGQAPFEHSIFLLSGLPRARLAAVSAHEYAHAWLHENVPADRRIDEDTVEGFCELVAYKQMTEQGQLAERRVILSNAYTRGQIDAFVKAEDRLQFYRIVRWLKTGVDEKFEQTNTGRLLTIKEETTPAWLWLPQATTPVPDVLTLKGISGTSKRRFALINNCTLEVNEEARVRVGASNVIVRCLEISGQTVTIQMQGSGERTRLSMREDGSRPAPGEPF